MVRGQTASCRDELSTQQDAAALPSVLPDGSGFCIPIDLIHVVLQRLPPHGMGKQKKA
jgi:hypothetical protein